jgi:hypothetical protein
VSAGLFGFCAAGNHAPRCPGSYRPFWIEGKTRVRYRDEIRSCSCTCHTKENDSE